MTATRINRNVSDLHPEDQLIRFRFQDWLVAEQERQNIADKELAAKVGHHSSWAHGVMSSTSWRVATMQRMAYALGYQLAFNVKADNVVIPPAEIKLADAYAGNPKVERHEEAIRRDLCDLGRRYREAMNMTPAMLGHRLRAEGKTVTSFETGDKPYYLLVTAQRFFRALGGELRLVLVKQEPNGQQRVFEAPEGRWPSATQDVVNIVQLPQHTMIWNSNAPETVVSFPAAAWKAWLKAND